jgi:hypothetical protein
VGLIIAPIHPIPHIDIGTPSGKLQQLQDVLARSKRQIRPQTAANTSLVTIQRMPTQAQQRLVSQQAKNVLTICEKSTYQPIFTPLALSKHTIVPVVHKFEHYANPMVHPVTGETISSYKKLMNDPATAEVWQTAFAKDFGGMAQGDNKGMAQGDNKTEQKGTDAMFAMTHDGIKHALKAGGKLTYCNPVVDHHPQKEDPNRIQLTAGGNLTHCNEELSVPTAGLETAKLHWNSVMSTAMTKYMCIDLKTFTCRQNWSTTST